MSLTSTFLHPEYGSLDCTSANLILSICFCLTTYQNHCWRSMRLLVKNPYFSISLPSFILFCAVLTKSWNQQTYIKVLFPGFVRKNLINFIVLYWAVSFRELVGRKWHIFVIVIFRLVFLLILSVWLEILAFTVMTHRYVIMVVFKAAIWQIYFTTLFCIMC